MRKQLFSLAIKAHGLLHKMDRILHERAGKVFRRELAEYLERKTERQLEVLPRVFEYSFAVRNLPEKGRIIEVGCAASSNALPIILAELGYEVYGIDLRLFKVKHPNFEFIVSDARHLPFRNIFQCGYSISTIEHVGLRGEHSPRDDLEGDSKAIKEMINSVKPGGSLIITVPFGRSDMLPDSRIYDIDDIRRLFTGLNIAEEEYIKESNRVWFKISREEADKADHKAGCRAVGMFKLHKQQTIANVNCMET